MISKKRQRSLVSNFKAAGLEFINFSEIDFGTDRYEQVEYVFKFLSLLEEQKLEVYFSVTSRPFDQCQDPTEACRALTVKFGGWEATKNLSAGEMPSIEEIESLVSKWHQAAAMFS